MQVDEHLYICVVFSFFIFSSLNMCNKRNLKKLALNLSSPKKTLVQHGTSSTLYGQGPACILPNLYLGAHYNAINRQQLTQHGINCIINVASEVPNTLPIHDIQYHHIQWTHVQNNLARSEFDKAIQTIMAAHDKNQTVLVHCQQGIERSAALVLAFLLYTTRLDKRFDSDSGLTGQAWTLDRALKFVKEKAPGIRPNMELLYQLREYEQSISKPKKHDIQTRTRRSESVACCAPSIAFTKLRRRPRSLSFRESSYTVKTTKQMDKHVLAIASLLVVLSAMRMHSTKSSTIRNTNNHLNTLFIKTVYTI